MIIEFKDVVENMVESVTGEHYSIYDMEDKFSEMGIDSLSVVELVILASEMFDVDFDDDFMPENAQDLFDCLIECKKKDFTEKLKELHQEMNRGYAHG